MKIRILQRKSNEYKLQRRCMGIWRDCRTNGEFGKDGGHQPFIGNQLTAAKAFKNQLENTSSSNAPKWRVVE